MNENGVLPVCLTRPLYKGSISKMSSFKIIATTFSLTLVNCPFFYIYHFLKLVILIFDSMYNLYIIKLILE